MYSRRSRAVGAYSHSRFFLSAASMITVSITSLTGAHAQNAPRLPDLASYNCALTPQASSTRHIGQVINGHYNEWYESFVDIAGKEQLACISVMRPTSRQLTRNEVSDFLTQSFAVGAPNATARSASPADTNETRADEDLNVQPEPLKRVREPAASGAEIAPKSTQSDTPPIPASKIFGDEASEPARKSTAAAPYYAPPQTAGIDDRALITDTRAFPWNTVAYLTITYPQGGSFRCTATLVSPYVVLTAGHCVHNNSRGGYVAAAQVYPGQTQSVLGSGSVVRPYPSKGDIAAVQTTAQWTQISGKDSYPIADYRYDYAAIQFKTPFTHTGTFMPVLYSSSAGPITSAGYPATAQGKSALGLLSHDGGETSRSYSNYRAMHVREFQTDASGGNSGGPFIYLDPNTGQSYLVGSLSYGDEVDDRSGGPWYDSWNQSLISSWVSWQPGKETIASSTAGLRVASVFSATQPNMMSYLRFFNDSNTAGTVDVTLADYATGATLGTWRSPSLPGRSSRQFSIDEIENGANASFVKPLVYSISVRPTFSGNFQNVLWRKLDATLTNLSTCSAPEGAGTTLINVHSSLLDGGYPSGVIIHNTSASSVTPSFGIYNAANGQRLGTYATTLAANSQRIITVGTLETAAGISANGVYHYNIKADGAFTGYLQHLLNNRAANLVMDMTATCVMGP